MATPGPELSSVNPTESQVDASRYSRLRKALYIGLVQVFNAQYDFPDKAQGINYAHPRAIEITQAKACKIAKRDPHGESGLVVHFDTQNMGIRLQLLQRNDDSFDIFVKAIKGYNAAHQVWLSKEALDKNEHKLVFELVVDAESEIAPFLEKLKKQGMKDLDIKGIFIRDKDNPLGREPLSDESAKKILDNYHSISLVPRLDQGRTARPSVT